MNVSKTSPAQYLGYSKKKTLKLVYPSPSCVAPQNRDIFTDTAGNIFNLVMFTAFTAVSTYMACHLSWSSATWHELHRTKLPKAIGFFQVTQRYPVYNYVFSLKNIAFRLVRYYTSCNLKLNTVLQFRFILHATHSNGVMKNNSFNVRSFFFQTLCSTDVK